MEHSKQVAGTIAQLREDRIVAAARLDTIDLALSNLERLYDHMSLAQSFGAGTRG